MTITNDSVTLRTHTDIRRLFSKINGVRVWVNCIRANGTPCDGMYVKVAKAEMIDRITQTFDASAEPLELGVYSQDNVLYFD